MKILNIYQNFFLRNLIVITFFIFIIFGCVYSDYYARMHATNINSGTLLFKIFTNFIRFYTAVLFSNIVFIRSIFIKQKYFYAPLFILYWWLYYYFIFTGPEELAVITIIMGIGNGTGLYFLHLWILNNVTKGRKEILNFEAELSFLKQQLNPHFLLNAMNNLYGESLSEPENVPDRILNLADMLRYQIEATKKNLVPLNDEINFIKRYVEYYTFRNEKLEVSQSFDGEIDAIEIPPLFFLPLVENALKFSGEVPLPVIIMHLSISKINLSFSLQNNFLVSGSRLTGTGIGIENLKRRLEVYGLKHELIATKQDNMYTIKLNIWELPTAAL